jgi:NAD(P)-dependent dehydrogenase (short-subunit alcohol dehydrogenase family)
MIDTLAGRRIAITGAARGIGAATARELVARGAKVAIGDIDLTAAGQAARLLGAHAADFAVDTTSLESFEEFLSRSRRWLGGLDVLINNAGIMPIGPYLDAPASGQTRAVEVNLIGTMNGTRVALPQMIEQGYGHIINLASSAGRSPVPGGIVYAATKAAVISFTDGSRLEFASHGLKFTCVMPAFTNTELIAGTKGVKGLRNVEPDEVARAITEAVVLPKDDVYVPAMLRPILYANTVLGRRVRDLVARRMGAYNTFVDIDLNARAAYERRIAQE